MSERGAASLAAIMILLMLAYLIRGTVYTAGNYVDMTRNFDLETRLQLAAESAFERKVAQFTAAPLTDDDRSTVLSSEDSSTVGDIQIVVRTKAFDGRLYPRTLGSTELKAIIIVAIAKKAQYFGKGIHAYRSIGGFLEETTHSDDGEPTTYTYEFKGYLHRTI